MKWGLGVEHEVNFFVGKTDLSGSQIKEHFYFANNSNVKISVMENLIKSLDNKGKYRALIKLPTKEAEMGFTYFQEHKKLKDYITLDASDTGIYFEFITPNFQNATIEDIIEQLEYAQGEAATYFKNQDTPVFIANEGGWPFVLSSVPEYMMPLEGKRKQKNSHDDFITIDQQSYILSRDYNGSYHVNVTLPISKKKDFYPRHHAAMKALQWMSPLFIAAWGQPDMFSYGDNYVYTEGSFRMMTNSHSRMGSVDLEGPSQETLKKTRSRTANEDIDDWKPVRLVDRKERVQPATHLKQLSDTLAAYNQIDGSELGADFRRDQKEPFGFEFRILDHFPKKYLKDVLHIVLLVCDQSAHLDPTSLPDARINVEWNELSRQVFLEGWNASVNRSTILTFWEVLQLGDPPNKQIVTAIDLLSAIVKRLWQIHGNGEGPYTKHMVDVKNQNNKPRVVNLNKKTFEAYARALRLPPGKEDANEFVPIRRSKKNKGQN